MKSQKEPTKVSDKDFVWNSDLSRAIEDQARQTAGRIAELEAELARLQWQPISAENLPKRGDELFCAQTLEVHQVGSRVSTTNWAASGWTHFRPINPPKETA